MQLWRKYNHKTKQLDSFQIVRSATKSMGVSQFIYRSLALRKNARPVEIFLNLAKYIEQDLTQQVM